MRDFLIPALMVALVLPDNLAKPLVVFLVAVFALHQRKQLLAREWATTKWCLLILLTPGLILTIYHTPVEFLRFMPITLLIVLFPYTRISLNLPRVYYTSLCIVIYLITSQILIAIGNEYFLILRDVWYPFKKDLNPFDMGVMTNIFFDYGRYRAGGIFHNPNVMASNLFLCFLMFSVSRNGIEKNRLSTPLFLILIAAVGASMYLTGSRTYMFVYILYIMAQTYSLCSISAFLHKNPVKFLIVGILAVLGFVYVLLGFWERMVQGFTSEGSLGIKVAIVRDYIDSRLADGDYVSLLFGGVHSNFDAEWGQWFAALGFVGLFSILIYYFMIWRVIPASFALVLCFLLVGLGNTLIYGMASAFQVLIVVITLAHAHAHAYVVTKYSHHARR